ncbi:MAG: response regulator, partial [Fibrobacteres bacterium]|nr:response regulator [Fibrobacterota bacterium]
LGGVFGYVDLARDRAAKTGAHPKIGELLDKTMSALDMARELSSQLLTFAKGGSPVRKSASISELIKESVSFALSGTNIAKQIIVPENLWTGSIDTGQIGQVLNNLLVNAMQAMPNGGSLTIKAENVTVSAGSRIVLTEGKYVKIDIKDSGTGISPDHINRIFEPFFTTKKEGSGMGLSICYSIIKKHGGHITVESIPDGGTTFTLFLPAEDRQIVQTIHAVDGKSVSDIRRILVLDDESYVLDMISMFLKDLEIEHTLCQKSEEAIELFSKAFENDHPFDAVLLDMTIKGGMGGDKVMEELLRLNPKLKGIAMSGYANNLVMADPVKFGFKTSIRKPFTINDFSRILSTL